MGSLSGIVSGRAAIASRGGLASGHALGKWWAQHCVLEGKSLFHINTKRKFDGHI